MLLTLPRLDNKQKCFSLLKPYTPYSARMSPHKHMGFYVEVLILSVRYTSVHGFCFFNPIAIVRLSAGDITWEILPWR